MTVDLVEFLNARLREDEAVANAAIGTAVFQKQTGRWSFEHAANRFGVIPIVFAVADGGGKTQAALLESAWDREERGAHIARWDPVRVLAECAAKRAVLELHTPSEAWTVPTMPGARQRRACVTCGNYEDGPVIDWPCATALAVAAPFASHPDYPLERGQ
jgi:hypothetical protein